MLKVVVIAGTEEQRALMQAAVNGTLMARAADVLPYPASATDLNVRQIQETNPDVLLIDIAPESSTAALRAVDVMHSELPKATLIAIGDTAQSQTIIHAMRAGAREFLQRPAPVNHLVEAFARISSDRTVRHAGRRGTIFTVIDAKGGSGATTVAVNLAMALKGLHANTALVDLAPLGHAALHLNVKPTFGVLDAIRNLHRLDQALVESFMTRCAGGLQLLAGMNEPLDSKAANAEVARLLELLAQYFRHVVVDCSARYDATTRAVCALSESVLLVAHTDVVSMWSAAQVHNYIGASGERDNVRLVLNRYRKVSGFSENDAEEVTRTRLIWKIPNHYALVANAIDRGTPVTQQNHSEIAASFVGLACTLTGKQADPKRRGLSFLANFRG